MKNRTTRARFLDDFRVRIALAATGVALAASLLVTTLSVASAVQKTEEDLTVTGRQLANWLAEEVVLGVLAGDRPLVAKAARSFLAHRDVAGAAVFEDTKPFVQVGRIPARLESAADGGGLEQGDFDPTSMIFRAPIVLYPTTLDNSSTTPASEVRTIGAVAIVISRQRLHDDLVEAIALNALVLLVAVILSILASTLVARRIARPVQRLISAAEQIGMGKLSVQVPVESADAIGRLSSTFNTMAAEVRRSSEELEGVVAQRTLELTALNKELEAFSYSVSHDLRAPLRHIMGFIELLRENVEPSLDQESRRYIQVVSEAAQRMGTLIDDLLALSRIGRATMTESNVNLGQLVDEVRRDLAADAEDRTVEWHIGPLPEVRADVTLLRAAVTNLLSNALKYTRPRAVARIEIGSQEQDREFVVFVRDNGVGFDMRFVDKLFGAFQRLHRSEDFEGTGIGLATVRRIILRHGGRLWAEGEVDRGASFYFSLPRFHAGGKIHD